MTFEEALFERKQEAPALAPVFDFYVALLELKKELLSSCSFPPFFLSSEAFDQALQKNTPLFENQPLPVSRASWVKISQSLCELLAHTPSLGKEIQEAALALEGEEEELEKGLAFLPETSSPLDFRAWVLHFVAAEAVRLHLRHYAQAYRAYGEKQKHSFCALCGSFPDLFYKEDGNYKAVCAHCDTFWHLPLFVCFCGAPEIDLLLCHTPYGAQKILVCDACHSYFRLLLSPEKKHFFTFDQERLLFLLLDLNFEQRGYALRKRLGKGYHFAWTA